jgi:hypothetical protein
LPPPSRSTPWLSLSPLVLIVVAAAGLVWGEQSVRAELLNQIRELVGQAGAETVRMVLEAREGLLRMTMRRASSFGGGEEPESGSPAPP